MRTYSGIIRELGPRDIFVFGSNLQGFHGAGSVGFASFGVAGNRWREFGYAQRPSMWKGRWNIKGQGEGLQHGTHGWSYALPTVTKAGAKRSRSFNEIVISIVQLYTVARRNTAWTFFVAASGSGGSLNGYTTEEFAAMFVSAGPIPDNVSFEQSFALIIEAVSQ